MSRLLALVGSFLLLGAATGLSAAPVPKGADRSAYYYPLTVGATWVYDRPHGTSESAAVAGVEKADGEFVVAREAANGNVQMYAKTIVSTEGLRQDDLNGIAAPVWLLKTPFRSGDSWAVPDLAGGGKRTVYGPEKVDVPAGQFQVARVVWERPGGLVRTTWYAPGVGEVKRVERDPDGTVTVSRSLKSFNPGKR